jgi:hypothetical protein
MPVILREASGSKVQSQKGAKLWRPQLEKQINKQTKPQAKALFKCCCTNKLVKARACVQFPVRLALNI